MFGEPLITLESFAHVVFAHIELGYLPWMALTFQPMYIRSLAHENVIIRFCIHPCLSVSHSPMSENLQICDDPEHPGEGCLMHFPRKESNGLCGWCRLLSTLARDSAEFQDKSVRSSESPVTRRNEGAKQNDHTYRNGRSALIVVFAVGTCATRVVADVKLHVSVKAALYSCVMYLTRLCGR